MYTQSLLSAGVHVHKPVCRPTKCRAYSWPVVSGVSRGQKHRSAPLDLGWGEGALGLERKCCAVEALMSKPVGDKITTVCCDRPLLAHSSNFIIVTSVLVSHIIFLVRQFSPPRLLRPGQLPPPLVTPLPVGTFQSMLENIFILRGLHRTLIV